MFAALTNFADFSGRASRSEFWLFQLLNILMAIGMLLIVAAGMERGSPSTFGIFVIAVWAMVAIIPGISVAVRRFHDHDLSGWWYLGLMVVSFIPYLGILFSLILLWIFVREGTQGPNRFGADPVNAWRGLGTYSETAA